MSSCRRLTLSLTTSDTTTGEITDFDRYVAGRVYVPAGAASTTLTFYDSDDDGTTWLAAWDDAATPAAIARTVAAGNSYPIPDALFACERIRIKSDAAEDVVVVLKKYEI